ncbi:uncharacterized protein LOC134392052 [Elgaria multicarinata webbii]|uniref:uncharacterized protein LOC134392052 n=1 Tax=Elgaria multicarinata webbii TaxID=159646 RepID=UPI002FCCD2E5
MHRRRRMLFLQQLAQDSNFLVLGIEFIRLPAVFRRYWVCPSSKDWWENLVLKVWNYERWIESFRMSRAMLFEIVAELTPALQRNQTAMREPLSVAKRVAIGIWKLANPGFYKNAAEQFGVGRSTVGEVFVEVCLAMQLVLLRRTVYLGDYQKVMDGFAALGFRGACGATDGTHIEIVCPIRQGNDFINRKNYYSMILQGTMDHTGRFTHIDVGWSGRDHDAHVFRNSSVFEAMDAGVFCPSNEVWRIGDVEVPPFIVADGAYPLQKWLMKPYGGNVEPPQAHFNYCLSRARNVVERAFGRLKSRWRCLSGRLEVAEENVPSVITACIILHNICEARGYAIINRDGPLNRVTLATLGQAYVNNENERLAEGTEVRDAICTYLWHNRELRR